MPKTHHCPQKSPEWFSLRSGCLLTASKAGAFLIKNDQRSKDARAKIINRFLSQGAYFYGDPRLVEIRNKEETALDFNLAVQRGNEYEAQAVECFSKLTGKTVEKAGFITTDDGLFGASPDGLIGEAAGLECKVPIPETQLSYILENLETKAMPEDYLYQVHFNLAVSERDTWHFYSHSVILDDKKAPSWAQHPYLYVVVARDKFTDELAKGLDRLRNEYRATRDKVATVAASQSEIWNEWKAPA